MYAEWRANGVSVLAVIDPVLSWKNFNAFLETAAFDWNSMANFLNSPATLISTTAS
jgi:hypothetical protein